MKRDSKNYKVRCVGYKGKESCFTIDKVYDVIDGKITNDNGFTYSHLADVIKCLSRWYVFEKVDNDSLISRVIFNDPATIILWTDGTKTIAKTHGDDAFDPEKGFAVACAKKLLGDGDAFRMEFAEWISAEYKRPNIEGFKVGGRVEHLGHLGTVIALANSGHPTVGVEFDKFGIGCHNCGGVEIKDGCKGSKNNSKWLEPSGLHHVKRRKCALDQSSSL